MDLKNLTVAFLGDSLTEGVGASSPKESYPAVFTRLTGLKEGLNYGISGTRIARQRSTFRGVTAWDRDFISRVDGMRADADCVVVMGSTNDYMHGDAELGCFSDRGEYTFYGAMHTLLSKLLAKYPGKTLIFMTPPHFAEESSPEQAHINKGHYFNEYLLAIKEVCAHYSVPVFDLHTLAGIDSRIPEDMQRFYSDTVHLNDNGYRRVAELLAEFLKNL